MPSASLDEGVCPVPRYPRLVPDTCPVPQRKFDKGVYPAPRIGAGHGAPQIQDTCLVPRLWYMSGTLLDEGVGLVPPIGTGHMSGT